MTPFKCIIHQILALFLAFSSIQLKSQEEEETVELPKYDFSEELKRYDFEIEVRALRKLKSEINIEDFAKSLKIKGSIHPPKWTPSQVKDKIATELQIVVDHQFPSSRYDEIKSEAENKYKMWKVGNSVKIKRQYGGQVVETEGLLEVVSNDKVKISGLPINKIDIDREDLARLFWAEHEDAITKYVRKENRIFEDRRKEFTDSQRTKISSDIWSDAGYRRNKKSGRWIPILNVFLHQHEKARKKLLKRLRAESKVEIYTEAGYINLPERGGWIPASILEEEKVAAKEEAKPPETGLLGKVKTFFKVKSAVSGKDGGSSKATGTTGKVKKVTEESEDDYGDEDSDELWEEDGLGEESDDTDTPAKQPAEDVSDLFDED